MSTVINQISNLVCQVERGLITHEEADELIIFLLQVNANQQEVSQ